MYNALIVDDEPRTRKALLDNTDWKRCNVRKTYEASGIREAKELLKDHTISVLICDIEMPGGTGQELVDWTREQNLQLGIIMVTCHPEFSYVQKAIRQGCYDYILKPIDYEEFSRVLHDMTGKMEDYDRRFAATDSPGIIPDWGIVHTSPDPAVRQAAEIRDTQPVSGRRDVEKEVKRYVKEHLADDLNVTGIAEVMHFNPQYLTRAFKAETGSGILEYITGERIIAAKKLLSETNIPVKEIAGSRCSSGGGNPGHTACQRAARCGERGQTLCQRTSGG